MLEVRPLVLTKVGHVAMKRQANGHNTREDFDELLSLLQRSKGRQRRGWR